MKILPKNCSCLDYCFELRKIALAESDQFYRIFHVPLKKYWDNMTGFNICGFDENVVKAGDRPCSIVVEERFGTEAVAIIKRLLDTPKFENIS